RKFFHFNHEVLKMVHSQENSSDKKGKWNVTVKDLVSGKTSDQDFDYVLVAKGNVSAKLLLLLLLLLLLFLLLLLLLLHSLKEIISSQCDCHGSIMYHYHCYP